MRFSWRIRRGVRRLPSRLLLLLRVEDGAGGGGIIVVVFDDVTLVLVLLLGEGTILLSFSGLYSVLFVTLYLGDCTLTALSLDSISGKATGGS